MKLWCILENSEGSFPVMMDETDTVDDVKKAIKKELGHNLDEVAAVDLTLWRINESLEEAQELTRADLLGHPLNECSKINQLWTDTPEDEIQVFIAHPFVTLWCYLEGDDPADAFSISIKEVETVDKLRVRIANQIILPSGAVAKDLKLWKLDPSLEDVTQVSTEKLGDRLCGRCQIRSYWPNLKSNLKDDEIHVFIGRPPERQDPVPAKRKAETSLFQQYLKRLKGMPAPSQVTHLIQNDPLFLHHRPVSAEGIPTALLHPVHGHFLNNCSRCTPEHRDFDFTFAICQAMANYCRSEAEREERIKTLFRTHYSIHLHGTSTRNAVTNGTGIEGGCFFANFEVKNVIGVNGDPIAQNVAYYGRKLAYWGDGGSITPATSRCPMFLIGIAGPILFIHGAAFGEKVTVDPLIVTDLACHSYDVEPLFRIFAALRMALEELKAYYSIPETVPEDQRQYPYFHVFGKKSLTYANRLVPVPNCLTFLATLKGTEDAINDNEREINVIVKFTRRYGLDALKFCAELGLAPTLHHFERLPGGWNVVVMEYVAAPFKLLSELSDAQRDLLRPAIEDAVSEMHRGGYIHGDLRRANILGDPDAKAIKIIDWDWAGRENEVVYPSAMNRDLPRASDAGPLGKIQASHDGMSVKIIVAPGSERRLS